MKKGGRNGKRPEVKMAVLGQVLGCMAASAAGTIKVVEGRLDVLAYIRLISRNHLHDG